MIEGYDIIKLLKQADQAKKRHSLVQDAILIVSALIIMVVLYILGGLNG